MKKAMIVRGGWDGHDPVETTDRFAAMLRAHDFDVQIYDTLDPSVILTRCWRST